LYAAGVETTDGPENLAFAFTEAGSVFAVRARDGSVVWQRNLGTVAADGCASDGRPAPIYGITSTGVIDRATNRLYVLGATGLLYALDLSTGEVSFGWPVRVIDRPDVEHVWSGLTLVDNRLYIAVASYCDRPGTDGFAEGRVFSVDLEGPALAAVFDVVPGPENLGGVWGYGGGSVDPLTGHLWTATGHSLGYDPDFGCLLHNV